ncbi:DUF488 domain-containing protein [Novosphingobium sp. SL115]|uniref:DUF488 domain-containing protein n=1 Tax=Novosphingobium sp. SL115 TaxID=2995150 RepID=UPI0022736CFB|nr:DUF488 domain-containing protein [Novosphingobium sp. SL115]MCY1670176.1 DUF488 domain-containing protein [Novosphingobium sp. SL115]
MLYTIGYSTRTLPEFLRELERRQITQLWDVRSSPWSRNQPFNANQIERWAERAGILYRQEGKVLGGRTAIPLDHPDYLAALDRILDAACREPVALMCSEGRPEDCHRTTDIAASLLARLGIIARSICRDGSDEDVTDTLQRVPAGRIDAVIRDLLERQPSLF